MAEHIHECGIEVLHETCSCVICGEQYPNRESAEPSKPAEEASKKFPHAIPPGRCCNAEGLRNHTPECRFAKPAGGAQESMNAKEFYIHRRGTAFEDDIETYLGVMNFADAYASERVAQLEKQVERLRAALRKLLDATSTPTEYDLWKKATSEAEAALATQLPTEKK